MEAKERYSLQDCLETSGNSNVGGKVTVLKADALPPNYNNQLFYCTHENNQAVFMISLVSGEKSRWNKETVLGVLKPELLSDTAKLHLSQIRPSNALSLENNEPKYSGYSFLHDGRYTSCIWLCSPQEVTDYIEMQKPYQHRILICDRDDFAVFEMIDGKLIFPSEAELNDFNQKPSEQSGGMEMK